MFRALPVPVALGRAISALIVVIASSAGHTGLAHHHLELARPALAFLVLLFVSWRRGDLRSVAIAATLAQVIVHGGLPMATISMLGLHVLTAVVSTLLAVRFERAWLVCAQLLTHVFALIRIRLHVTAPSARTVPVAAPAFRCASRILSYDIRRRGPPAFA